MKQTKTSLDKLCEKYWKAIIHAKLYCEVCGKPPPFKENEEMGNHNAHHIITKKNHNLRWDIRNGANLCPSCHKFGNPSAHGNPIWFAEWLKSHRADDYEYLKDSKWTKTKVWRIEDYQEILKNLKVIYDKINP